MTALEMLMVVVCFVKESIFNVELTCKGPWCDSHLSQNVLLIGSPCANRAFSPKVRFTDLSGNRGQEI